MPSLDELKSEDVWNAERIPLELANLRSRLLRRYDWPDDKIGIIGDQHHLAGYHRSRAWIEHSRFCTDRTYSVTETDGNRFGGSSNHVAAMDILIDHPVIETVAARLRHAKAAGRLPMIRQIIVESGPSHIHLSFDRGMLTMSMQPVLDAIVGVDSGGNAMTTFTVAMPVLKQGATGPAVKTAQTLANLRGANLKVDGEFGPLTADAVMVVQKQFGAEAVDAIIGPETWTILLAGEDQN